MEKMENIANIFIVLVFPPTWVVVGITVKTIGKILGL
ncbi:hypothetical protein PQE75_gp068 [Bacillus phage vB_BcoS-136]|uniref:Uncharacterized protein n=1 Tax=Bacillus phage vB_BcoS-136 TaxID=2419619 RepID=A0A3G3BVN8_9CAUD|nr:hypothetical protein PQE75_gp068 [Bacillus phage vB_BcoS-136]AYP68200.1 hypothetical protein vBBcoS136_00068 [Bacillus phage vB_BcoS-136]